MDHGDAQRVQALCERLAAFIEANDATERGPITMDGSSIHYEYAEGERGAWVEDRNGGEWCLYLTKRMTEKHPTGTDTIHEIRVFGVLEHEMTARHSRFPEITLRMDAYPAHQAWQHYVRDALAACAIPVSWKYVLRWESGQQTRTPIALDAWTPDDGDIIAVEFDLSGIEAFADELLRGTVVLDYRSLALMREREARATRVAAAYRSVTMLTRGERRALNAELIPIGTVSDVWEYRGISMADTADWESDARGRLQDSLICTAAERGAKLVAIGSTDEAGGLVTSQLAQTVTMFTWRDAKRGPQRLAAIRGAAVWAVP